MLSERSLFLSSAYSLTFFAIGSSFFSAESFHVFHVCYHRFRSVESFLSFFFAEGCFVNCFAESFKINRHGSKLFFNCACLRAESSTGLIIAFCYNVSAVIAGNNNGNVLSDGVVGFGIHEFLIRNSDKLHFFGIALFKEICLSDNDTCCG